MAFDAYRKWLGISSKRRPPTFYDLLGVEPGENDNDAIRSALEQRRAFIKTKRGEGHDELVAEILVQLDHAASTLLVSEFKNAYDRHLGLHPRRRRLVTRRSYLLPTWMESNIVRIYGEGSGAIAEALGLVSVIFVFIALMVGSGLWLKTETTQSEPTTVQTWLEIAAMPTFKQKTFDSPGTQADAQSSADNASADSQSAAGNSTNVDPKSSAPPPLPKQFRSRTTAMEFVVIPPGTFVMGSPEREMGRDRAEIQHTVTISRSFYLGKYEVTQPEFQRVMGFNPSKFTESKRLPVEGVTWFDAVSFCNKLSELDGFQAYYEIRNVEKDGDNIKSADVSLIPTAAGYRLPTEAESEYACRAGTTTAFSFGDNIKTFQVNYDGKRPYVGTAVGTSRNRTIEVDAVKANAWGLSHMHGNVWEWCQDWEGPYESGSVIDPQGPPTGSVRVGRGGAWNFPASACRSAFRVHSTPNGRDADLGFRVALVPPAKFVSDDSPSVARDSQSPIYPIGSVVEARINQDNDWHVAKVLETWESLHLCRYESLSSELDEWVTVKRIRPTLAGAWSGSWQNDLNEQGPETLSITQNEKDFIEGLWSNEIQIQGERIGQNVFIFDGMNNPLQYRGIGFLDGDRLRLEYRSVNLQQGGFHYGWEELKKGEDHLLPTPRAERRRFSGSWSGPHENSKSQSSTSRLNLVEENDAIAGDLSGIPVRGFRIGSTSFHLVASDGQKLYNAVGYIENDRLILNYSATSNDERYFGKAILSSN